MFKGKKRRLIPALLAVAFSGGAFASGFQLLEQNASGIGNAYAGSAAVAENASTIFYNPAGMTKLQSREFSAGVSLVRPGFEFSNQGSVIAPATGTGNGGDAGGWAVVPNGFLSWALNKDLYVGIGISAPFGLKTEYNDDWVGRFQAIKFDVKTININPSIAYRLNDVVSLGAGVNWQKIEAQYVRQLATAVGVFPANNTIAQNTRVKLDIDDDSWGWNAGAMFDLSPTSRVGVSYRSAIKHTLEGTLNFDPTTLVANVNAKAAIKLPDTLILSGTHRLSDQVTLLGDISWTGWSSIPKVDIVRTSSGGTPTTAAGTTAQTLETKFRDTWRVAVGGTYHYNNAWDLKFGVAYDQTPVRGTSERLVSLPDNDRVWLSVGAQWKLSKEARVDFGGAYLYVRDTNIDNNQTALARGRVTGSYDSNVWLLGAQYSQSF